MVNGEKRAGETPFLGSLEAGKYKIKLSAENYQTLEKEFFLEKETKLSWFLDKPNQLVHHLLDIKTGSSPKGAAFSPDGKEIWTSLLMGTKKAVDVFNAESGERLAEINLENHGGVEVLFNYDGSKAYVSQMETDTVYEIDVKKRMVLRKFATKSTWCKIMELSPDAKKLYVSNWSGQNISEINLETGKIERLLASVDTPRGLFATKDGKYLYVAGFGKGELQKIDLETGKGEIIFKNGGALRHIAADEEKGLLFISDMAKAMIFKLDLATNKVENFVGTDKNPNTIALSPDKKILYVSCRGTNASESYYVPGPDRGSVLLFDAKSGEMLDAVVGGNQPTALAISKDGGRLVFSNFLDSNLSLYEIPSYEVLKNVRGGRSKEYKKDLIK